MLDDVTLASQLRKPSGEIGRIVAQKMNENNAFVYQQAFSLMNIHKGDHVLEIGFGNGRFLAQVLQQASEGWVAGIDFSQEMVQEALFINQAYIQTKQIEIQHGSFNAIPYADSKFDKVFTINTIYFLENPQEALKEAYRVLKPGGMIGLGLRTGQVMKQHGFTQHGFSFFELTDVIHLLQQAGFDSIHHRHEPDLVAPAFDALSVTGLKV
jgi:SAM-dependent methyltransferase